ncbi:MAG: hypothetical protein GWQ08_22635, partial [Verrucomicrobiaceae bacterium]|nr:hypothetical protein [Verrucomicrobiaceae bacterium]
ERLLVKDLNPKWVSSPALQCIPEHRHGATKGAGGPLKYQDKDNKSWECQLHLKERYPQLPGTESELPHNGPDEEIGC